MFKDIDGYFDKDTNRYVYTVKGVITPKNEIRELLLKRFAVLGCALIIINGLLGIAYTIYKDKTRSFKIESNGEVYYTDVYKYDSLTDYISFTNYNGDIVFVDSDCAITKIS